MTGNEKAVLASFFDLAGDYLSGGFNLPHEKRNYKDDPSQLDLKQPSVSGDTVMPPILSSTDDTLETIAADITSCTRCGLCNSRKHAVPGEGVTKPLVMVIGEGPGEDEDNSGRPFVGRAGQLLDRMLDSKGKISLSRNTNCYIANILKCRPPGNRTPQLDEICACVPFLARQIKVLRPKIILAAGNTAAKALLDSTEGITKLRGTFTFFKGTLIMNGDFKIPLLPTFHPSALLRDESLKAPVWEDLKTLRKKLCDLDENYAACMINNSL